MCYTENKKVGVLMMKIHADFIGGNIRVTKQTGNTVYLENEIRDTTDDWFYWAFCVEGAAGEEINFRFATQENRIGYFGPAISHDLENWHWLNAYDGENFTYHFAEDEDKVYFAHSMLYHPSRFEAFAKQHGKELKTLCTSRKGRQTPYLTFGEGEKSVIFAARHHACESTGNYVLEGLLERLWENPIEGIKVFCVPFVDYDGVLDGDQGKSRAPHDQNRDYLGEDSIYAETKAIQDYADQNGCNFGFDFHSPWHYIRENDTVFIVRSSLVPTKRMDRFSHCFEQAITEDSMAYDSKNDYPPNSGWNKPSPTFGRNMGLREECEMAFTLETTYFGLEDNKVSQARLLELGRCFAEAFRAYLKGENQDE